VINHNTAHLKADLSWVNDMFEEKKKGEKNENKANPDSTDDNNINAFGSLYCV